MATIKKVIDTGPGSRLRSLRSSLSYSRSQLAELLELKEDTLLRVENGKQELSLSQLKKACRILRVDATWLLWGSEDTYATTQFSHALTSSVLDLCRRYNLPLQPVEVDPLYQLNKEAAFQTREDVPELDTQTLALAMATVKKAARPVRRHGV